MKTTHLLLAIFALAFITSCSKPGCTDPDAVNYDAEAKSNDGSCVFDRDKFIGTYEMEQQCEADDYPNKTLEISSGPAINEISIKGWFDGFSVTAKVDGNELSFKKEFEIWTYEGTGYYASSAITIDYSSCLTENYPCPESAECTMICFKIETE